jgi:hypothetical protein
MVIKVNIDLHTLQYSIGNYDPQVQGEILTVHYVAYNLDAILVTVSN